MDNVGNLKRNISRTNSGTEVLRYTYDRLYRVTEVEKKEGSSFVPSETFAYDAQDNITSFNGQTFNHNSIDQLTSALSSTINYDGNGSADQIQGSESRTITTNYADLPTEISNGSTSIAAYTYNGDRQRISRTIPALLGNQQTFRYLWAGSELLKEYNGNGSVRTSYILGVGREAIKNGSGQWRFYITDRLGSTRMLTDASGVVTNQYNYSAYGDVDSTGDNPFDPNAYYNPFLFTGQQLDANEGHYYLRNRYYSPKYGRFLVADPIRLQGGMNMYAYCAGNPINCTDPDGLEPYSIGRNFKGRVKADAGLTQEVGLHRPGAVEFRFLYEGADWIPVGLSSPNKSKLYLTFSVETYGANWLESTSVQVKKANVSFTELSSARPSLDFLSQMRRTNGVNFRGSKAQKLVIEYTLDGGSPPQGTLIGGSIEFYVSSPNGRGTATWEFEPTVFHPKYPDASGGFAPLRPIMKQSDFKYEWP